MKTTKPRIRETVDMCIAIFLATGLAVLSMSIHLTDKLYVFLRHCKNQPLTDLLINVSFLLLTVLLWSTYRRWRKAILAAERVLRTDDLTGLYNRRAFMDLAADHLKAAHRGKRKLALILVDLDGMKQINDTFGHQEGDAALKRTARALRESFRESDIVARLGGDEFAILALDYRNDNPQTVTGRIQENLDAVNAGQSNRYPLSASVGIACNDAGQIRSTDELLAGADELMYEHKKMKSARREERQAGADAREARPRVMIEVGVAA